MSLRRVENGAEGASEWGPWIRAAREERGYTMDEAVRRVVALGGKLTVDGLSRIERGKNGARLQTLQWLATAYDKEIGDLLPHTLVAPSSRVVEPLLAALVGLDEDEIASWINQYAQMATLQRGHMRRSSLRISETKGVISAPPVTPTSTALSEQSDKLEIIPVPAPAPERDPDGRETRRHDNAKTGRKRTG